MTKIADRVKETTTTTGTGAISLAGVVAGYRAFSSAFVTADVVYYCITDGTDWEVGSGALSSGSPWTLARTTVLASSNAGALVNFTAGSKEVFCTLPAMERAGPVAVPSATPSNSYCDLIVPNPGTFIDNVMTVQNLSDNGAIHGNAAFRFVDSVNSHERAAMGYSRVSTGTPGGWYANLLYAECGNLIAADPDDTDFAVVVTHGVGATNFPSTSLKAIEVVSATGAINMRTQGGAAISAYGTLQVLSGDFAAGSIGAGTPQISHSLTNMASRFREYGYSNSVAWTSNVSNLNAGAITQDDAAKSSWKVSMGHGDGGTSYDNFKVARAAAGVGTWTDLFEVRSGAALAPVVYSNTTASSANVFVDTDGTLKRSTSSEKFKGDVEAMSLDIARRLVEQFRAVWYRSLCPGDKPDWSWYGAIAEEVALIDPRFVHWGYQDADYESVEVMGEEAEEPLMDTVIVAERVIEFRAGIAVQIVKQVEKQIPRVIQIPVVDEAGNAVMLTRTSTDANGEKVQIQYQETYSLPVMKKVQRMHTERRLKADAKPVPVGLQYERFTVPLMMIAKADAARIAALEAKVGV